MSWQTTEKYLSVEVDSLKICRSDVQRTTHPPVLNDVDTCQIPRHVFVSIHKLYPSSYYFSDGTHIFYEDEKRRNRQLTLQSSASGDIRGYCQVFGCITS